MFITETMRALKSELRAHATAYTRSHVTLLSCGQKVPVRGSVWLPREGSSWSRLLSREARGRGRPVIAAVNECASECGPGDGGFNDSALDPASDRSYVCIGFEV